MKHLGVCLQRLPWGKVFTDTRRPPSSGQLSTPRWRGCARASPPPPAREPGLRAGEHTCLPSQGPTSVFPNGGSSLVSQNFRVKCLQAQQAEVGRWT